LSQLTDTFAALGEETRFAIVERLLKEGELSAGDLREGMAISPPAISRHLKVLRHAGIIERRVERQKRIYSVRPQAVELISSWTISHREFWQASMDRLERALMEEISRK
jgi:DNA-binding transcriptional ArsR family regulator